MSLLAEQPLYTYQKPAARVAPAPQQMMGLPEFKTSGEIRLLILDDDPQTCHLIQALLSNQGFVIDTLSDPSQVEGWLKGQQYHLIIMDYVLPGLEAEQVLHWIRDHQPEASVIVVTAFPTVESALNCLRARTYDYLTKPFQVEQLRSLVVRCLENKGLLRMTEEALARNARQRHPRQTQGPKVHAATDVRQDGRIARLSVADRVGQELGLDRNALSNLPGARHEDVGFVHGDSANLNAVQ